MASKCESYALNWNGHGANFSTTFNEFLRDEEMVDVTLVADGHLFKAHRLVLSALSPHFRKMFMQMPTTQQAFVFLKDVSKQTVEDLITYIYNGEVNVASVCLADFMSAAKSLDIKGLTETNNSQSDESFGANHTWRNPAFNGVQYQSTQINQNLGSTSSLNQTNPIQIQSAESNYFQPLMDEYGADEDFKNGNTNEMTADAYKMETSSLQKYENAAGGNYSMNQDDDASFGEWNGEYQSDSQRVQSISNVKAPTTKRRKRNVELDLSEYDKLADIRVGENGRENLYFNNQKFYKHGKANPKQRWACTKERCAKCRSAISTVEVDGVTVMKVLCAEHTH